ncbi:hypothetical protein, partial [Ruegeria arenilitoris]|uniref:hypothetical protein n=1 Tax=Ruegeria arenilitoris TaxID=1173585 RepID=UPI001C2B9964
PSAQASCPKSSSKAHQRILVERASLGAPFLLSLNSTSSFGDQVRWHLLAKASQFLQAHSQRQNFRHSRMLPSFQRI